MTTHNKTLKLVVATLSLLLVTIVAAGDESERCEQQFQSQQKLNRCQAYLRDSIQIGSEWRENFQQCCQLLDRMDEQCRCQGIRKVVQQQRRQEQLHGTELQEMLKTAESLPGLCRVGPQRCDVRADHLQKLAAASLTLDWDN